MIESWSSVSSSSSSPSTASLMPDGLELQRHLDVSPANNRDLFVRRGLAEHTHGRPLDDHAQLVGGLRQLGAGLGDLDARPRMDREDALGLEHPQRIAQRPHRDADQLHQIVLRDESARWQPPVEQGFEDPRISEIAQPLTAAPTPPGAIAFSATCASTSHPISLI